MPQVLIDILTSQLKIPAEKITLEATLKGDLGADSLDLLQLLMALEDRFGITVPDEALAGFERVKDVTDFLASLNIKM